MSYDEQNVFSFHLNESLWFQKGQEVDEFMGVSLEPDIAIHEYGDTVSIRGVIELTGEYYQVSSSQLEEEEHQVLSLRDHASKRLIEEVETHEDGVSECYHRFPVEISIPRNRIDSVDDVTVSIDAFDYELPEKGQLKLNATVAIHGVKEERAASSPEESASSFPSIPSYGGYEDLGQRFHFDVKYEDEPQAEVEERNTYTPPSSLEEPDYVEEEEEEQAQGGRWNFTKSQSFSEFFGNLEKADTPDVDDEEEEYEYEYEEEDEEEYDRTEEAVPPDARYLTSMFGGEEEPYTKMRMCIVQDSDTLGSLAQKYKIPPTHLSRVNNLGDDDVSAGQILYIPSKA
ncbi:stage VI sporulation protein D [Pontibacillus salicampi]|uniref:Stage VI sporulation protein D n=1 Tax=Pontibacillus salicampi TaxID=1449801 RepID=A0ABV6LJE6_9BACI